MSLRTSVYEFLGIINLMASATIFTSVHIETLLLSLHFLKPEFILQLRCYYCFSLALIITDSYFVLISMLGRLRRFLGSSIYTDSFSLWIFQWCSWFMISTWSHRGRWSHFSLHMWSATPDFSLPLVLQPSGVLEASPKGGGLFLLYISSHSCTG